MRALLEHERPLAQFLFELAGIPVNLDALRVQTMDDGGMGSLRIEGSSAQRFGSCAAECYFYDADGTEVWVALDLDESGAPFEIDVWRVDFGPTRRWPSREGLRAGSPSGSRKPTE